jgi:hypothetical protein
MRFQLGLFVLFSCLFAGGCGAELSRSDLGTVVFELPKVAGASEPYPMPELGPPLEDNGRRGGPHLP